MILKLKIKSDRVTIKADIMDGALVTNNPKVLGAEYEDPE